MVADCSPIHFDSDLIVVAIPFAVTAADVFAAAVVVVAAAVAAFVVDSAAQRLAAVVAAEAA